MSEYRTTFGSIPLSDIYVDEELWGEGAEVEVLDWLVNKYDPRTMPVLAAAEINDTEREGYSLLGWNNEGTEYAPLLHTIFGEEYAEKQLARREIGASVDTAVACPRCNISFYTPIGEEGDYEVAPPPALSRTTRGVPEEERVYVCTWCGQDEAMEEFGGRLTPQSEWPVIRPGSFGVGRKA